MIKEERVVLSIFKDNDVRIITIIQGISQESVTNLRRKLRVKIGSALKFQ